MIDRIERFNSIVVRLKVRGAGYACFATPKFQFHSGSIKRVRYRRLLPMHLQFQFHSGSIKSSHRLTFAGSRKPFQFHSGSIKSEPRGMVPSARAVFQFHSGSIKSAKRAQSEALDARFNSIVVRLKEMF